MQMLHQLRLVIYPIIYRVLAPSQGGFLAGFLNHQRGIRFWMHILHTYCPIFLRDPITETENGEPWNLKDLCVSFR